MPRATSSNGSGARGERARILLVAGVDPSGGAGLDVDVDTARGFGCEPIAIATAHTDQDDREVRALGAVDPGAWLAAATSELSAPLGALKFGLLPGREHVAAAALLANAIVLEETSYTGSATPTFGLHSDIVPHYLLHYGSDEIRRERARALERAAT